MEDDGDDVHLDGVPVPLELQHVSADTLRVWLALASSRVGESRRSGLCGG
jgi:hypothetical protein